MIVHIAGEVHICKFIKSIYIHAMQVDSNQELLLLVVLTASYILYDCVHWDEADKYLT